MSESKRAIVLGGGGARGAYQIGVWQALREMALPFHIVTGSSVGALNAALMVQDDFDAAKRLWESLGLDDLITGNSDLAGSGVPGFRLDPSPLKNILHETIDEARFRASPIDFGLVTVRFPSFSPAQLIKEEIPEGSLVDYLMASASYFPVFQAHVIDGKRYVDGAFADNLPAKLALRCGAEDLVVVDLAGYGIVRRLSAGVPVTYIRSRWHLGEILGFDPMNVRDKIELGRLDTLKAYRRMEGSSYTFPLGESRKNALQMRRAFRHIREKSGVSILKQYYRLPHDHQAARYHDKRFIRYSEERYTLGMAITTVAEIAGESLGVAPYRAYTFEEFNHALCHQAALPHAEWANLPLLDSKTVLTAVSRLGSQKLINRFYTMLRHACGTGRPPDAMWGLAAVSPREFLAAHYLLALAVLDEGFG